jgi:hypothetical protein
MKIASFLVLAVSALLLLGCGKPVPQEKAAYVGEWTSHAMYLNITQDGQVNYKRKDGNTSTEINAPIKDFHGNDFDVGIGPMSTTFTVSKTPYQDGAQWKMVVDGVELVRDGP